VVNRVFCYSNEEAKKNGNYLSIGKLLLQTFLLIISMVIMLFVIIAINFELMNNFIFMMTFIIIWTLLIITYAIKAGFKMHSKLMGFATDTTNNIYCAIKLNNGEEFAIGGLAVGNIVDMALGDNNSALGDAIQVAGAAMALYSMDKSAKIMQNPEVISKMVEYATTTTGADVRQILKVHSYTESKHKVKIKCDYKSMRSGKIKYGKNMTIYKSYNHFNELLNLLCLKR